MAQTKRKRRSKHRGNAAGTVETRGRTGRKPTGSEKKNRGGKGATAAERRADRLSRPPSWRSAINRAAIAAGILLRLSIFLFKQQAAPPIALPRLAADVSI